MAKLTDSISTFQTGDLVFVRYPPKGDQPIHVTVFLEPAFGAGNSYVHAGATELEIANISTYAEDKDSGGYLHVSTTNTALRAEVANIAALFARTVKRTPYGSYPGTADFQRLAGGKTPPKSPHASRFTGMIRTKNVSEIPFTFPALHRLLKWTHRALTRGTLSENRGITCAAFAAACHQVAGMKMFCDETALTYRAEALLNAVRQLDRLVETKDSLRKDLEVLGTSEQTRKPIYRDQAYRENSNRKPTEEGRSALQKMSKEASFKEWSKQASVHLGNLATLPPLEKVWLVIQCEMLGIASGQAALLSSIIDPAFFFDAKYVSSPALAAALRASPSWRSVEYNEY